MSDFFKGLKYIFISVLIVFISSCASTGTSQLSTQDGFFLDFGVFTIKDDVRYLTQSTDLIVWTEEVLFGVYVENLAREEYQLGLRSFKFDPVLGDYLELEQPQQWHIFPPVNQDYEAFLTLMDDDVAYKPGCYRVNIYIDLELTKTFDFTVISK